MDFGTSAPRMHENRDWPQGVKNNTGVMQDLRPLSRNNLVAAERPQWQQRLFNLPPDLAPASLTGRKPTPSLRDGPAMKHKHFNVVQIVSPLKQHAVIAVVAL